jgi:hypothetical protein
MMIALGLWSETDGSVSECNMHNIKKSTESGLKQRERREEVQENFVNESTCRKHFLATKDLSSLSKSKLVALEFLFIFLDSLL